MADNETIADIIAWLRMPREGENAYLTLWRDEIADRLKAARRRERGNSAAMRKALMKVRKLFDGRIMFQPAIREAHEAVNAALAAPPRNCDVGTAEEQEKRFHDFCRARHLPRMEDSSYCAYKCPLEGGTCCELQWAQMPYEEGGAK